MPTIDQIASTPGFNAGSVDVQPSNTKVTKITKKIDNLQPGVTYTLLVRAKKNGQFSDYVSYQYTVPETDKSGNNFTVSNSNTDIQLLGGGFAASSTSNPFPINIGKIDITQNTIAGSGTGVIMNQYGIAGFKNGNKQFSLSAITGDAYFAGTISVGSLTDAGAVTTSSLSSTLTGYRTTSSVIGAGYITTGILKSGGFTGTADGVTAYTGAGMAINLDNNTITSQNFNIDTSGNAVFKGAITATSGTFNGSITAGSTITGATLKTGSGSNYIEISQQSDVAYGSFGKIIFTTGSTYDGGIYASSGIDLPGINSPHIIIESPKQNSSYTSRITLVGDNDGYIKFEAGNTYVALDSVAGLMQLFQTSDNLSSVLNKTGFRNVYVSSTAGNPSPASPQNGDIKLEW